MTIALVTASVAWLLAGQSSFTSYDDDLCRRAQLMAAGNDQLTVEVLRGKGNGFHTIQMDTDAETGVVTVAAAMTNAKVGDAEIPVSVACKMVNSERVADVMGVAPLQKPMTCDEVNRATYGYVLERVPPAVSRRYLRDGVQLRFGPDYVTAAGGEWLPLPADQYIEAVDGGDGELSHLEIRAPTVRVPWDADERSFHQGTQHCKLITAAAMESWILSGAFSGARELFPSLKAPCYAPSSESSAAGSCLFWFAPAQSQFCKDYSGPAWTSRTAQEECGKRHASQEALQASDNKYAGAGGVYAASACAEREDAAPLGGTCVFHCNAPDESLWRMSGQAEGAAMMTRACDLYIE